MRQRLALLAFLIAGAWSAATAQFAKTIHATFPTKGVEEIRVAVVDSVTVATWAGDDVLVQTDVRLSNTTEGLFKHLTGEASRYRVTGGRDGGTLHLVSAETERRAIDTSVGVLEEEIHVKVWLPEDYVGEGGGPYVLRAADPGR